MQEDTLIKSFGMLCLKKENIPETVYQQLYGQVQGQVQTEEYDGDNEDNDDEMSSLCYDFKGTYLKERTPYEEYWYFREIADQIKECFSRGCEINEDLCNRINELFKQYEVFFNYNDYSDLGKDRNFSHELRHIVRNDYIRHLLSHWNNKEEMKRLDPKNKTFLANCIVDHINILVDELDNPEIDLTNIDIHPFYTRV